MGFILYRQATRQYCNIDLMADERVTNAFLHMHSVHMVTRSGRDIVNDHTVNIRSTAHLRRAIYPQSSEAANHLAAACAIKNPGRI